MTRSFDESPSAAVSDNLPIFVGSKKPARRLAYNSKAL
jgi:hypothetical protein